MYNYNHNFYSNNDIYFLMQFHFFMNEYNYNKIHALTHSLIQLIFCFLYYFVWSIMHAGK